MTSTEQRTATPGRGRDLPVMKLDVLTGDGGIVSFESVLCPRERRAMALDECLTCVDARGPVTDPTARGGFIGCSASVASSPGPGESIEARSAADRTPVAAVMARSVLAVSGDVPLAKARAALLDGDAEALPVVDRAGRPIGLLRYGDFLGRTAVESGGRLQHVRDAMTRRVPSIAETAPVSEAAALMAFEAVPLVPAVSREGRVVGIVTALDLVRWLADQDDRGPRRLP